MSGLFSILSVSVTAPDLAISPSCAVVGVRLSLSPFYFSDLTGDTSDFTQLLGEF